MRKLVYVTLLCLSVVMTIAQTKVTMTKKGGVYEVPCKVNGKEVSFIFDSGAADVLLSTEFFNEGLKSGIFKISDVFADVKEYQVASGAIVKGRNVNIRQLKIGDLVLYNVVGSIMDNPNTPMLLGQSAIEQFGTYAVDYNKLTLTIQGNSTSKIELEIKAKSKVPGQETLASNLEKCLAIRSNLEFEVAKITDLGASGLMFAIDITNATKLDYNWQGGVILAYSVEITTEDGKRYTSSDMPITLVLLGGQTGNSSAMLNIRGKRAVNLRIYSKIQGY
jgi:clan AA aspartic protease (TIGR02281 family)